MLACSLLLVEDSCVGVFVTQAVVDVGMEKSRRGPVFEGHICAFQKRLRAFHSPVLV